MVYFDKENLQIPRHSTIKSNRLVLINELSGDRTVIEFTDLSTNDQYYLISKEGIVLKNGTYRYEVGPEVGLLQVGEYESTSTDYNEKKTNVVYER